MQSRASSTGAHRAHRAEARRRMAARLSAWLALGAASCAESRVADEQPPTYRVDIAPLLAQRCAECHSGAAAAGGWRATSFLESIACVASGAAAALPADVDAPILRALDTEPHRGRLDARETALLRAWITAGAPAFKGTVHVPGIVDPRSDAWHGTLLRDARWAPMLDAKDPNACGRCHEGAPARPDGVTRGAPGATACTTCHAEPQGPLACGTCHGNGARAEPPRDACFFPGDAPRAGAHTAHVEASALQASGLPCTTCHPAPGPGVIGGLHGNGSVEIVFDAARVGAEASYDRETGTCAVGCHDQGGARARPSWHEAGPMRCGDCHTSPPAGHYPGACTACHHEADAKGASLSGGPLHMNGRVDLGDGSGACGACHGKGADPWPSTAAHPTHAAPSLTTPIDCASCHVVPQALHAAGHLDGVVEIAFGGRAKDRGANPTWDGTSCNDVACHGGRLPETPAVIPAWRDTSGSARACGACHGIPPTTQHTTSTSCDRVECHGSEVARSSSGIPSITPNGRMQHVNGAIDLKTP